MTKLPKAKDFSVLGRIATSWGLFFIMVLAPLCWGLLPIGYGTLNSNEAIKANPLFTVFMRMTTSFTLTGLCAIGMLLWFGVFDRNQDRKDAFHKLCRQTLGAAKSRLFWLFLLAAAYFGARAIEMRFVLTYHLEGEKFKTAVVKIQDANDYLGKSTPNPNDLDKWSVKERTTRALKDYGYFMGLMLALLLAIKNNKLYGALSKGLRSRFPNFSDNLNRLKGDRMSFVGKIFWGSTLFLTIASGVLYISAKEPLYVWPYMIKMTGIACVVALCTSFGTDCKIMGNVNVSAESKYCPAWKSALLASIIMNLFQAGGTALLALVIWFCRRSAGTGFSDLASQYFDGRNGFMLIFVIGLLGSVVAPIAQLSGVNLHNAKLKRIGMMRYGVTGSDWLKICGGFEPLFVVLIGLLVPMARGVLISPWPMIFAVATVVIIALLKIAEVWSEKNSAVRNAIFAKVRGSTQDTHEEKTDVELRERAEKLSFLKFYDKRHELSAFETRLTAPSLIDTLGLSLQSLPCAYLTFLVNGQQFFTQDDPFTNDVLRSHELYLKRRFPDVELVSLKRYLVNGERISTDEWKKVVRPAVWTVASKQNIAGTNAMPYVLISKDEAKVKECAREWSELLEEISKAVQTGEIDEYVNGMIIQMKGE